MRLRRIEVQNFRKLVERVVIEDIADGVTIVAGDNEDGKSTILQALRAVLFDRHTLTGDGADAMQPFGHKVRPEICVHFEIGGFTYELSKGFCQRPSAELTTPTGTLAGDAVEEKLRELLCFRAPGRGQSRAEEHHGICGLFWVEQGGSFKPLALNPDNRSALTGALEGEVGQILGGTRGRALKEAIAKSYGEFFSEKTGRQRGPLAEAHATVEDISGRLKALKEQLQHYEKKVDELARTRERLSHYQREGTVAKAQAALTQAEKRMKEVDALRQGEQEARNARAIADAGVQGPAAAVKQRADAVARAARDAVALASASAAAKIADREFESRTTEFDETAASFHKWEVKLKATEQMLRDAEQREKQKGLEAEAGRLTLALTAARGADELARTANAKASLVKVDAAMLRQLRGLDEKRVQAEAALAGSSTLLRFQLARDGVAHIAGVAAPRNGEISVAEPTTIAFGDIGQLSIIPGGNELPERRKASETTSRRLHEALQKINAATVAQAQSLWEDSERDRQEAANQANVVKVLAPDGIEALESRLAEAQMALNFAQENLPVSGMTSPDEARAGHDATFQETQRAHKRRDLAQEAVGTARESRAGARATLQSASDAAAESVAELKAARDWASDESLREALAQAGTRASLAAGALEAAEAALRAVDPQKCQLEWERARDSLTNFEKDIGVLERVADTLAIELNAVGQRGLGEAKQELEGQFELAVATRDRLGREGESLKLLHETICRAEKLAREAFLEPVQARVRPYLRLLLPDAELVLSDADLGITHLRRAGHDEPYDSLSIGAREQIAVLTRLAFADLLRERGILAPVILDDALVNSDPRRFESMVLALRQAARELQIIVLTCHETAWMQAGAPVVRLTSCMRP